MDFMTDYEGVRGELSAMTAQVNAMRDNNDHLRNLVNALPGAALGGAVLMNYVDYLNAVSSRVDALLIHLDKVAATANAAVDQIEATDSSLMQRAGSIS